MMIISCHGKLNQHSCSLSFRTMANREFGQICTIINLINDIPNEFIQFSVLKDDALYYSAIMLSQCCVPTKKIKLCRSHKGQIPGNRANVITIELIIAIAAYGKFDCLL
jgi:hypothetical protein